MLASIELILSTLCFLTTLKVKGWPTIGKDCLISMLESEESNEEGKQGSVAFITAWHRLVKIMDGSSHWYRDLSCCNA